MGGREDSTVYLSKRSTEHFKRPPQRNCWLHPWFEGILDQFDQLMFAEAYIYVQKQYQLVYLLFKGEFL